MSKYTTSMSATAWAQPNIDLENPHFAITVEWTWPSDEYWSRFQIVRSVRSPAVRAEEGMRMLTLEGWPQDNWHDINHATGNPVFLDPQPPPGEWTYYSLFVLDTNRVWVRAGYVCEIGPADYDWALRLPELLPGVSVSREQGVTHPSDQDHDLVQFLQVPGTQLDISVTMAEAAQYFWEPTRVPPQLLPALTQSWGYKYNEAVGSGRNRQVMASLRDPVQGSLSSIAAVASAAMGAPVDVVISNNLMLDINDSSFEDPDGSFDTNRWYPKDEVEMIRYDQVSDPIPILAPNLILEYFLRIHATGAARTFKCGYEKQADGSYALKPATCGIPISTWTKFRMGCYAYDDPNGATITNLTMGMDFYDWQERYMGTITAFGPEALNENIWSWHGNDAAETVPITGLDLELLPADALTNAAHWMPLGIPYSEPQTTVPVWSTDHLKVVWNPAPTADTEIAFWGIQPLGLEPGYTYIVEMEVKAPSLRTGWRVVVSDGEETVGGTAVLTGESGTMVGSFEWVADRTAGDGTHLFGVEGQRPSGGWSTATDVQITRFSVRRKTENMAYGVPWFTVTDACCLDLIVVDDG